MTSVVEHDAATHFAMDVAEHRMIVRLDQGLHRHLVFESKAHSWNGRFELITAPGSLTITGDRGDYTFRRLLDMFQFFRSNPDRPYRVNIDYWAEKLGEGRARVQVYSEELARERIHEAITAWNEPEEVAEREYRYQRALQAWEALPRHERGSWNKPAEPLTAKKLWEMLEEHSYYGAGLAHYDGAREFLDELEKLGVVSDVWEWDLNDYDLHFVWCLHAIAWGIQQYDLAVRSGLHKIRTGPMPWDTPLPTTAPAMPEPLVPPADKPALEPYMVTVQIAGGAL